jgi:hypothetical protein
MWSIRSLQLRWGQNVFVILRPDCSCVQFETMVVVTLVNILWENVAYMVKIVLIIMSHRPQNLLYFGHNWGYRPQFKTMAAVAIVVTFLCGDLKILFITISDRNLKAFINHLFYETLTTIEVFQWKIVLLDKDTFLNLNVNAGS